MSAQPKRISVSTSQPAPLDTVPAAAVDTTLQAGASTGFAGRLVHPSDDPATALIAAPVQRIGDAQHDEDPAPLDGARMPEWSLQNKHVYLIGIGGCGMSGLARMLTARGAICEGSDKEPSDLTSELVHDGYAVSFEQEAGLIPSPCDLVIASAAIKPEHPEVRAATAQGVPVLTYAEALGKMMEGRTGVSIAGTHGKSTTTALLAHVLITCGKDPSFIVGATSRQIGGGSRSGSQAQPDSDRPGLLVAEACEFNRSFHHHRPTLASILNVEEDHLDIYGNLDAIIEAFRRFARLLPPAEENGYLLIGHENAQRGNVAAGLQCAVETIGLSTQADWSVAFDPRARRVTLNRQGAPCASWASPIPGEHNAYNAAVAAVLAHRLGCAWSDIVPAIESFAGVDRRMQRLGSRKVGRGEVVVYDDYGHHPTEVDSTLRALRAFEKPKRLICVFQPHQHSRTRFLLDQFAASFSSADVVIVPHIYFVRDSELEKTKVSAADLVDRLRARGIDAMHIYPFEAIVSQLERICRSGDLVVAMGAGPVWQVAHQFLRNERSASK